MTDSQRPSNRHWQTRLAQAGRDLATNAGAVNPPVQRATTLIIDNADDLYRSPKKTYALDGMAVHEALKEALIAIEGGCAASLAPSGLAACTLALSTVARAGGELLVVDCVYAPTRRFCDTALARMGVRTRYFDPRIGGKAADLISANTCGIFLESPGSFTLEIQDVPAITATAHERGIPVILDNTWSAGVCFKPFEHGVDLSVQALTKYQGGHADAFLGAVIAGSERWAKRLDETCRQFGLGVGPDDAYLVLRGMRSLAVRLERQSASAMELAQWLARRPEIARVLHPALDSHPDHEIWRRDFCGATGVFAVVTHPCEPLRLKAMLESLQVFSMGFSWGGYESLIVPVDRHLRRQTRNAWAEQGVLLRVSVGLEHPQDLIDDLARAFAQLSPSD